MEKKNRSFSFFAVKGPAADATDTPQPWGLLWNPVMKMISFISFFFIIELRWNEIDWWKTEALGEKPVPVPLSTTNPTWTKLASNPVLRGGRPTTNRLSHGTAQNRVTP
jgi:hypothetical protein